LGPLPKTESVRLTFACPVTLKADLDRYAALYAQTYGEAVDAVTLIPHMLEAFMARDRGADGKIAGREDFYGSSLKNVGHIDTASPPARSSLKPVRSAPSEECIGGQQTDGLQCLSSSALLRVVSSTSSLNCCSATSLARLSKVTSAEGEPSFTTYSTT